MLTWLLLIPAAALFMAINVILGCYVAIRLGYGPPDWKTALNLVVRVAVLQDWLNIGRDRLGKKAPWADGLLERLHIPKPIIIVEIPVPVETYEIGEPEVISETYDEPIEEAANGTDAS